MNYIIIVVNLMLSVNSNKSMPVYYSLLAMDLARVICTCICDTNITLDLPINKRGAVGVVGPYRGYISMIRGHNTHPPINSITREYAGWRGDPGL